MDTDTDSEQCQRKKQTQTEGSKRKRLIMKKTIIIKIRRERGGREMKQSV